MTTAFLVGVALKVSVLVLAALLLVAALGRGSAAFRHWILAAVVATSLAVPVLDLVMPALTIPLPAPWAVAPPESAVRITSTPAIAGTASTVTAPPAAAVQSSRTATYARLAFGFWLGGVFVGLAALAAGILRIRQLASRAHAVSSGTWSDVAAEVRERYGLTRPVRLLVCDHPAMLVTWGTRTASILLPAGALEWPEERVRVVLHHELAHVRRGDWLVVIAARILKAVHWFNPLVWIACRQLRHEGERACDDLVLAAGVSGADYATHLLDIARDTSRIRLTATPAIAIAHPSTLEERVRAMLNVRVNRRPLSSVARIATLALASAVTVPVATASLAGAPAQEPLPAVTSPRSISEPSRPQGPVTPAVERADDGYLDVKIEPFGLTPARARGTAGAATLAAAAEQLRVRAAQAGQVQAGTIEGVLYDPYGGLLPGANVKLTGVATGAAQASMTDRGGAFAFRDLPPGDYQLVTDLPGFTSVTNHLRAESGATVRRHITLPLGSLDEVIHVTCDASAAPATRPGAPSASPQPGRAAARSTPRGAEPTLPSTFTGGIGGQIKVPLKYAHTNPVCPSGVPPRPAIVKLAGRIGIDGLLTDLRDVSAEPQAAYYASAMEAVRQWVFSPTLLNGAPIEANIVINVDYRWD